MELQKYFNLEEYVDKIELTDQVLAHLQSTSKSFDEYFKILSQYGKYAIYFWIDSLYKELIASSEIEGDLISLERFNNDLYISRFAISHSRIYDLHKIFIPDAPDAYRDSEVKISGKENGKEVIYWWGPEAESIMPFMKDFVKFYQTSNIELKYSNPFIKSFLVHLLFVRIHPFKDGNGRTARLLQNIKFAQLINSIYGTRLKISPLNISQNILINKPTYADRLNAVQFSLDADDNIAINRFIDYLLNMVDEQLFYAKNKLLKYAETLDKWSNMYPDEELDKEAEIMRLKRIFHRWQ